MTKLRYIAGPATSADWEEMLYHIILPVKKGIIETDDQLAVETLVRRGTYEVVGEGGDTEPVTTPIQNTLSERQEMIDKAAAENATEKTPDEKVEAVDEEVVKEEKPVKRTASRTTAKKGS